MKFLKCGLLHPLHKPLFPKSACNNTKTCKRTSGISSAARLLPWSLILLKPHKNLLISNQPPQPHLVYIVQHPNLDPSPLCPTPLILTSLPPLVPPGRVSITNAPPSLNPACRRAVMDVHITATVYKASVNTVQPPQILSAQSPRSPLNAARSL